MLTMLENDAAKGESWDTTEHNLGKAIIQSCFYGTYAVPPIAEWVRKDVS